MGTPPDSPKPGGVPPETPGTETAGATNVRGDTPNPEHAARSHPDAMHEPAETDTTDTVETLARFDHVSAELWDDQPAIIRAGVAARLRLQARALWWTEVPGTEPQSVAHRLVSQPGNPNGPRPAYPGETPDLYMIRTTMKVYHPPRPKRVRPWTPTP